jgi:hypothetical protein
MEEEKLYYSMTSVKNNFYYTEIETQN